MIFHLKGTKRKVGIGVFLLSILTGIYLIGPAPSRPIYTDDLPQLPSEPVKIEEWVADKEAGFSIKPDNEARIVWFYDSNKTKTPYSLVYLHGFSSSQEDGDPIHTQLAQRYGMNLYLSRIADHGLVSDNSLLDFTASAAWEDAKGALAIGSIIGEKVIVLSTSTGGTLSLMLSSRFPDIAGQILMSPNIAIKDPLAWMLNNHWGLNIAKKVLGGDYRVIPDTTALYSKYWNGRYRVEALPQLEELIETTMKPSVFHKIHQPTLLLYYYKDEVYQDQVVRVEKMLEMFDQLGTEDSKKKKVAVPNAGNHAIGSYVKSHNLLTVEKEVNHFCDSILGLKPIVQ
ncbi:MAG: alpha/beta hydrolase [Saprospiraceae bacterium]|nr:alpha/beta hydrolase [Saprospiraceae bacterium]